MHAIYSYVISLLFYAKAIVPEIIMFRHSDDAPVSQGNKFGYGTIGTRKQGNFYMALHDTAQPVNEYEIVQQ